MAAGGENGARAVGGGWLRGFQRVLWLPSDPRSSRGRIFRVPLPPLPSLSPALLGFIGFKTLRRTPALPPTPVWTLRVRRGHTATLQRGVQVTLALSSASDRFPTFPGGGGDGAVGTVRFFQGWACSQSPFPNHPPPIQPLERGVATSPSRSSVSWQDWEGPLGVEGCGGSAQVQAHPPGLC